MLVLGFFVFVLGHAFATVCVGHRGDRELFVDNSLEAIFSAYERGAGAAEFDVRHTRDGVPIVFHDYTFSDLGISKEGKQCPLDTPVAKLKWSTIKDNCLLKNGDEIPLLEDVLALMAPYDFMLLIEFKNDIRKSSMDVIEKFYKDHPERIRVMRTSFPLAFFKVKWKKATSSFWRRIKTYASVTKTWFLDRWLYNGVDVRIISDKQIKRFQKRHKEVSVYTLNTQEEIIPYFEKNVDFVTTDKLSECLKVKEMF